MAEFWGKNTRLKFDHGDGPFCLKCLFYEFCVIGGKKKIPRKTRDAFPQENASVM